MTGIAMKLLLTTLLTFAALSLAAGPLNPAECSTLFASLDKSAQVVLAALDGVSDAQWKFKPAPDRWSIAECAEHIVTADPAMFNFASQQLLKMAPPADAKHRTDEEALAPTLDRDKKVKTAEFLEPKGRLSDRAASIEAFRKSRDRIVEYVKATQDDLRAHGFPSPNGYVDGYQFLLTIAAHGERHAAQIAEVKADPAYPKK
jgi:uncharacterized damage-inducible protein DinB